MEKLALAEFEAGLNIETEEGVCSSCQQPFTYRKYLDRYCAEKGWPRIRQRKSFCDGCLTEGRERGLREQETSLREHRCEIEDIWLGASGIPPRYVSRGFALFDSSLQPEAYDMAQRYLALISDDAHLYNGGGDLLPNYSDPSLFLASSTNGTGKTHLACAIASEYLRQGISEIGSARGKPPCPVLFTTAPSLFLRIRGTYRDQAPENEADVINHISNVALFLLDDVGKEKPSDYTRQTYFTIINSRYNANAPMVITSNLILPDQIKDLKTLMGESSVSRLKEMTEGWRVVMQGKDYRFREHP